MSAVSLNDTNLFTYCRNNPVKYEDTSGNFINTVIGAIAGGMVAAMTVDQSDENYVLKVALGALTGAISGLGVDIAIASTGGAAIVALVASGAIAGGYSYAKGQ